MGDIGPLSNEFSGGNLVIDVAAKSWVKVCPEGGDEVIWFFRICIWDRVWKGVGVVGIWKKGKISVAAQEDEVPRYREYVEGKYFSKINFLIVVFARVQPLVFAQGNFSATGRNIIERRAFPGR